jgi:hypothetical protein
VEQSPEVPDYQARLGDAEGQLGRLLLDRGRHDEARPYLEGAVKHLKIARAANPRQPNYAERLDGHVRSLAAVLFALGDHGALANLAEEWPRWSKGEGEGQLTAAGWLASCVPLAENDVRLALATRAVLMQRYADRAMELLREARRDGFKDIKSLNDSIFDPLRERDDFKKLLEGNGARDEPQVLRPFHAAVQ